VVVVVVVVVMVVAEVLSFLILKGNMKIPNEGASN
jgi:hypothetical protein